MKRGFSLIEIMIVIAIIGILSGIAIPTYMTYLKRAKIAEVISILNSYKVYLTDYVSFNGVFPEQVGPITIKTNTIAFDQNNGGYINTQAIYWDPNGWLGIQVSPALGARADGYGWIFLKGVITSTTPLVITWYCGSFHSGGPWDFASPGSSNFAYLPSTCSYIP